MRRPLPDPPAIALPVVGGCISILTGVLENTRLSIARNGGCWDCDSIPHEDGSISHDEDCCVPEVEAALAQAAS